MAKRRGSGEGSIYQVADGRWRAEVSCGYKMDGKPKRKILYGATRLEVSEALKRTLTQQQQGMNVAPQRLTVAQCLTDWLENTVRLKNRETTYRSYESIVRTQLIPGLGKLTLEKLTPQKLQAFLNERHASGLSPASVKHLNATMRASLSQAVRWGLVHNNAAKLVSLPRMRKYKSAFLSPDQAKVFLAAVSDHPQEALFSVALSLGLRRGEISGLRWQDIDWAAGSLRVTHALQRVKGKGLRLGELKSEQASRTLHLPRVCVSALLRQQERQSRARQWAGSKWRETDFIFTTGIGTPLNPEQLTRDFKEALKDAGLPDMRLHDLRHSCASLLFAQGVHPKLVQATLGHSTYQLTMDTYSHIIPQLRNEVADSMDLILSTPTKSPTKPDEAKTDHVH